MSNEQVNQNGSKNGNKSTEPTLDELKYLTNLDELKYLATKSLTNDFVAGELMGEIKTFSMLFEMIKKEINTMIEIPIDGKIKVELLLVMFDLEKVAKRLIVIGRSMLNEDVSNAMDKVIDLIKSKANKDG